MRQARKEMEPSQGVPGRESTEPGAAPARKADRFVGIDVARGCAVLGMFATHLGPQNAESWSHHVFNGRAAGLFALLAGVSVALITGGARPRSGAELNRRRVQLAVRAVLLFVLGLGLTLLGTTIKEILTVYAVLFLIALPLVRLRPGVLAVSAASAAIAGPALSFLLRSTVLRDYQPGQAPQPTALGSVDGWTETLQGLLVTGPYPALTWLPFLLAGMAVGKLDLRSPRIQWALLGGGTALAAAAYALSWWVMTALDGWNRVASSLRITVGEARTLNSKSLGAVSTEHPLLMLDAAGHSGSSVEIFAVTGIALAVIGACLLLTRVLAVPLQPLAAVGALPLSAYAGHIVLIALLQLGLAPAFSTAILAGSSVPLLITVLVTLVVLTLWRRLLGRGPLEWLLHRLSTAATPRRG